MPPENVELMRRRCFLAQYGTDDEEIAEARLRDDVVELRELGGHTWRSVSRIVGLPERYLRTLFEEPPNEEEEDGYRISA